MKNTRLYTTVSMIFALGLMGSLKADEKVLVNQATGRLVAREIKDYKCPLYDLKKIDPYQYSSCATWITNISHPIMIYGTQTNILNNTLFDTKIVENFFTNTASFFSNDTDPNVTHHTDKSLTEGKKEDYAYSVAQKITFPDLENLKLKASDFQKLFLAMKTFHDAYNSLGDSKKGKCKEKAIEFLKATGYVTSETKGKIVYKLVEHTITVDDANNLLKAFKRAYVNAISDNLEGRETQKEKSSGILLGNNIAARLKGQHPKDKNSQDSNKQELYPEDLYEAWEDKTTEFPAAVVTDEKGKKKRTACVNGLKKKYSSEIKLQLELDKTFTPYKEFSKVFEATIEGRPSEPQK